MAEVSSVTFLESFWVCDKTKVSLHCLVRSAADWCKRWSKKSMWQRVYPCKGERKKTKMWFLATPGSACKQQFVVVMVGVLDVKSLVEHNGEQWMLEVLKVYCFRDIYVLCNVLRICNIRAIPTYRLYDNTLLRCYRYQPVCYLWCTEHNIVQHLFWGMH